MQYSLSFSSLGNEVCTEGIFLLQILGLKKSHTADGRSAENKVFSEFLPEKCVQFLFILQGLLLLYYSYQCYLSAFLSSEQILSLWLPLLSLSEFDTVVYTMQLST